MDALNKLIESGENVSQLLMGNKWDKYLEKDDEDYTGLFMELTRSSS